MTEMPAWSRATVRLTHEQAAEIAMADLVNVVAERGEDTWALVSDSRVGVASGEGWELRVHPQLDIPRLLFLLSYARDPRSWKDQPAAFASDPDLVSAIANGFSVQALKAIEAGMLRGYVSRDECLPTVRGRVRFDAQISRRASLPLPVEVSFDDYTENVLENQILKTAALVLLRLPRLPALARKRLLKLRASMDTVDVVQRPREVKKPLPTRTNTRYTPALVLGELVLHASSIDAARGEVAATSFVFDMNKVFEDFVTTSLVEAMRASGGIVQGQWTGWLDRERRVAIRPDVTWWKAGACRAVVDAKYKALPTRGMPNGDAYQMLSYCVALGLSRGFLVYAKSSNELPHDISVRGSQLVVHVRTLEVEAGPDVLLDQVGALASEIVETGGTSGS